MPSNRETATDWGPTRALEESESRLRLIADTLPAYVAYVDAEIRYVMVNRVYEERFGLAEREIVGRPVAEVLGASYENVRGHLEAALAGEPQHFEAKMQSVEGERVLRVAHLPDRDGSGKVRGVIVHGFDVTERRRAEEALVQSEKLAAVGRLASSIAHEINNPLESVVNLLYLIEHTVLKDGAQSVMYAQLAQQELARVSQIATQTLRFFKQTTAPEVLDLGGVMDSVLAMYRGRLMNSGVEVERKVRGSVTALCFDGEIRQVLNNLVGNAIDAMRTGGRMSVRVREAVDQATGRRGVRVTVADTGHGMGQETARRIFEPFFTMKGIMGTGLGLWVSKGIVEKHDGRLQVKSRIGTGTVFSLFLPETMEA